MYQMKSIILVTILVFAFVGCGGNTPATVEGTETKAENSVPETEVANPASANCVSQGGKVEMQKDENGSQFGVCIFDDGSRCEEWSLFKKNCAKGQCSDPSGICP